MSKDKQSDRRAAELNKKNLARANLSRQSLGGANLARANLRGANLTSANLVGANLAESNLMEANLSNAIMVDARLSRAKLTGADFAKADVHGAYTEDQYLSLASLIASLRLKYPGIEKDAIIGHSDIASERKTDPGEAFDWEKLRRLV